MKLKRFIAIVTGLLVIILMMNLILHHTPNKDGIRIAVIGPMSGKYAVNGQSFVQGIQLFQKHLTTNKSVPIVFETFDDQNNADKAHDIARQIAQQNRHVAVIGHHYSSCSIRAGQIYKQFGIPAISPASTNINVTRNNDWYFRTIFNDYLQSQFLAVYVKKVLKKKHVSIIHEDLEYGAYLGQVFEKECKRLGVKISFKQSIQVNNPHQDQILSTMIDQLPIQKSDGILFLAMHAREGVRLVQMLKDRQISIPVITPDAFASQSFQKGFDHLPAEQQQPGFYTNGIYVITPIIYDTASEQGQQFRNDYIQAFSKEPGWHAAFAYDTTKVLYEVLTRTIDINSRLPINEERQALRDALAQISSIDKSINGITGYNYFNGHGDCPKPVSVGVYKQGRIISAMNQLQAESANQVHSSKKNNAISLDNQRLTQTRVVYTGMKINEISDINIRALLFSIDCYLWFRFKGDLNTEEIVFKNVSVPFMMKKVKETITDDGAKYHLYHLKGRFKADFLPYKLSFGQHLLGLSFHHESLNRNHLIYVVDMIGMEMNNQNALLAQLNTGNVINPSYGWMADQVQFFQSSSQESALGAPEYLDINSGLITYSQFNLGVRIKRSKFGLTQLNELFPGGFSIKLLIVSTIIIVFLTVIIRKQILFHSYSNTIWFIQTIVGFLMLLTCEIMLLNTLIEKTSLENVRLVKLFFDTMWWLLPAWCLNVSINRFIWNPLERKAHRKIPTVVKRFVAFIIFLLSIFGIIAFVFGERITGLLATSGVFAMIIGLAVQMNISNIFSGIALNIERPFRTGDWVKIGDFSEGQVLDISWRTTRMRSRDNSVRHVPNSIVSDNEITNYCFPHMDYENHFIIHIDPSHAPDRVKKIILDALLSVKEINNDPPPFVRFKGTTEFSTIYGVFYSSDQYAIKNQIEEIVWTRVFIHLKRANIHLAMRRHRIYMTNDVPIEEDETTLSNNLLKDIELFKPFSEVDRSFIIQRFRHHHYRPGHMIVRQGDDGESLFIIVEGVVSITINVENNKNVEVGRLGAENIFGEMALLTGEPRSANVISLTETHLLEISKDDIAPLIAAQPEISNLLGEILTQRKQMTNSILTNIDTNQKENTEIPKRVVSKILGYFGLSKSNS